MRTNRFRINGPIFELWPEPALSGQNASENDGNFFYFLWSKKPQDVHTEKGRKRKFAAKKVDTWTEKEPSVVLGTFPVLQVGLARHKQSHCAHSTQMMCEISIVKLTMEIDRSVSISGYSHSGAARTVIKLEVYWFVLTHSPGKNYPNEKVREKKRRLRLRLGGTPQIDCMQCSFSFLPFAPLLIAGCGRVFTPCWFAVVL